MVERMADPMSKWTPAPDWRAARIVRSDWSAVPVPGLFQTLMSGNLDAAFAALTPTPISVGLWRIAVETPVALRIGRDRALLVSTEAFAAPWGWQAGGWAASDASDAYTAIRLDGSGLRELVAEATAADVDAGSASASILFAGVPALLYRLAETEAQLHVSAPLAAYVWRWLETRA